MQTRPGVGIPRAPPDAMRLPYFGRGHAVFDAVEETIGRLGSASMMTEFGGAYFSPDPTRP